MSDLGVIDLSSSPERPQFLSPRSGRTRRRRHELSNEVTDVDALEDDNPIAGPSKPVKHTQQVRGFGPVRTLDHVKAHDITPVIDIDDSTIPEKQSSHAPSDSISSQTAGPSTIAVPEEDPIETYTNLVLEIVPDVLPEHARRLVLQHFPKNQANTVEHVLHDLFEDPTYPKIDRKGKGKRKRDIEDDALDERNVKPQVDYASIDRECTGGPTYIRSALVCSFHAVFCV